TIMKKKFAMILILAVTGIVAGCGGDHTPRSGKDTAEQKYNQTPNVDTSKTTTTNGSAPDVDNSGSGGTKVDSAKIKTVEKKK
ncbi:MAG: hypothetical protein JWR50_1077, partial [Mucilaginibacter sp.]|nr:hypothetical protein [Mucilaginibacter sp.]